MDPLLMRMAEDGELLYPEQKSHGPTRSNCRYALERTDSFIKVWFWGRDSSDTPAEVANGMGSIDTDNWVFSVGNADLLYHKRGHQMRTFRTHNVILGHTLGRQALLST